MPGAAGAPAAVPGLARGRRLLCCAVGLALLGGGAARGPPHGFAIVDAKADIQDLDVGDLEDMEADVPPTFRKEVRHRKAKPEYQNVFQTGNLFNPQEAMLNQDSMKMAFVYMTMKSAESLGKEGTDKLATTWKTMLQTGGVNVNVYGIDRGQMLVQSDGPGLQSQVKNFVISQPETDWYELDGAKFYPEGRTAPLMSTEARKAREIELGWKDPPEPKKGKGRKTEEMAPTNTGKPPDGWLDAHKVKPGSEGKATSGQAKARRRRRKR